MIQLYPVFYIATLIAPPGVTHWNCAHIVPSTIYANTTLRLDVISLWNSLPTHVVTTVSVDSFKNRLDKFWANEEARTFRLQG